MIEHLFADAIRPDAPPLTENQQKALYRWLLRAHIADIEAQKTDAGKILQTRPLTKFMDRYPNAEEFVEETKVHQPTMANPADFELNHDAIANLYQ